MTKNNKRKILVLNLGSSSIKFALYAITPEETQRLASGLFEKIGNAESQIIYEVNGDKNRLARPLASHEEGLDFLEELLTSRDYAGILENKSEIDAIGHRVVHGGDKISKPTLVDDSVVETIREYAGFSPLHNPVNLKGILKMFELLPDKPQVAVFDTAFHATIPFHSRIYGLPFDNFLKGIKKYGFHGTSHRYVALEAARLLGKAPDEVNLITCHLGNGSSIAAIEKGKSIDTSMGFTPLEGLIMGTRVGDIDPGAVFHIMLKCEFTVPEMENWLNKNCGMMALAGIGSQDMRDIWAAAEKGNHRAMLALRAFSHRVAEYVGGYAWHLKGDFHVVFTGGIGEKDYGVREMVLDGQEKNGIILDKEANNRNATFITVPDSPKKAMVIHTDEELMIAKDTCELLKARGVF